MGWLLSSRSILIILLPGIFHGIYHCFGSSVVKHVYKDRCLVNHVRYQFTTPSSVRCAQLCLRHIDECASINYVKTTGNCDLNKSTKLTSAKSDFKVCPGTNYYDNETMVVVEDPIDCADTSNETGSGVYTIKPVLAATSFSVYCDMRTDDGGWTLIQKRYNGSVDFNRSWVDFKQGFGNVDDEHWLGNEKLYILTSSGVNQLRIDMEDFSGNERYAIYSLFSIEDEANLFRITLGDWEGDAGESMLYANYTAFTTYDNDNDFYGPDNCAILFWGGWWSNACHVANLNGLYLGGPHPSSGQGVKWKSWLGSNYSLKRVEMKIRRVG